MTDAALRLFSAAVIASFMVVAASPVSPRFFTRSLARLGSLEDTNPTTAMATSRSGKSARKADKVTDDASWLPLTAPMRSCVRRAVPNHGQRSPRGRSFSSTARTVPLEAVTST